MPKEKVLKDYPLEPCIDPEYYCRMGAGKCVVEGGIYRSVKECHYAVPSSKVREKEGKVYETEHVRRKPCFGSRHMDFEDCTDDCEDAQECLAIRFKMLQGR